MEIMGRLPRIVCVGSALLLLSCGGAIERESGSSGANASQSGAGGDPTSPGEPVSVPPSPPAAPSETTKAVAAARSILVGHSFRAVEIDIGGYPFGTAPTNYRETITGEMMKICFGPTDTLTVCECDDPLFAPVSEIAPGGHPTNRCAGTLVCRDGQYRFDEQGRLRLAVPGTTLTWALQDGRATSDAGVVATVPEGTYVRSLIGLGDTLLEPTDSCP